MELLKTIFPFSFVTKNDTTALVVNIVMQLIVGLVASLLIWLVSFIPVINVLIGIVGVAVDLYVLTGIVLTVLDYMKVLK